MSHLRGFAGILQNVTPCTQHALMDSRDMPMRNETKGVTHDRRTEDRNTHRSSLPLQVAETRLTDVEIIFIEQLGTTALWMVEFDG